MTTPVNYLRSSRRKEALTFLFAGFASLLTPIVSLAEEAPNFTWAVRAGGPKHDKTRGLTTDAEGNIFMTGEFAMKANFGTFIVESKGDLDFFVAKYSPEGKCVWVRTGGGSKIDRGYGVDVDAGGNVFVTGHCLSTDATFDGTAFPNRGDYDLFVAKYDAAGKLLWLRSGGGPGYDYGHSLGVDKAGNCYVTGALVGDVEFAGTTVTNARGSHTFLAKLTPRGGLAWLRLATGAGSNAGQHVAVDAEGHAVIVGSTSGASAFGTLALTTKSGRDAYAVKFDGEGKPLWALHGGGSTNAMFASVALDGRGDVCLSGMFQGTLKLGGKSIESRGAHDLLVAKVSRDGNLLWHQTAGGPGTDYALCIAADAAGNCYATGEFTDEMTFGAVTTKAVGTRDLYLAKFDASGTLRWLRTGGGPKGDLSYCVAMDRSGNFFLSGAFDGTTSYGKTAPLTSEGSNDIMLLKLSR